MAVVDIQVYSDIVCPWCYVGRRRLAQAVEQLDGKHEVRVTWKLRRALAGLDQQQALEVVLGKLKETQSNVEFLVQMQKSIPAPTSGHSGGRSHADDNSIR